MKIMRCLSIYRRKKQEKKKKKIRKIEEEKIVKELVLRRFWKQKRVFEKAELERIPVQKA